MIYHVEERKLYCPYCNSMDTEKVVTGNSIGKCESCGGEWSVGDYELSAKCPYCSQYIIYDDRVKGEYEPSKILPFKVGKAQAKTLIRKEYQKKIHLLNISYIGLQIIQAMKMVQLQKNYKLM